ncbi:MAG: hypothetical protein ACE5IP_05735 [Terriglobia bacterium]
MGRIVSAEGARVVVERETYSCGPSFPGTPELLLLTLGTQSQKESETHFHPLASLAFDTTLPDEQQDGHWMALWVFGPSRAGWRRNARSLFPLPVGAPHASKKDLRRLERQQAKILAAPDQADLKVPAPVLHLANLGRSSPGQGIWSGLKRGLSWANVVNPAQFLFRTYLVRRKDRRERDFKRTYLVLQWLLDQEVSGEGEEDAAWLATLSDMRFHLLRNRSLFGRFLAHADMLELVYNYESDVRRQLGKSSSWLQSAANEHSLRYQAIYRYTENGTAFPIGGVLYYDPRLPAPEPGWWEISNPFDLPYNPHVHPEVQRLARAHPDEWIPLAVYTFQTDLMLRPIIAIDFFAPGNPRTRESTQQTMVLFKQWLAITTGTLGAPQISYRLVSWAANKKGYTLLVTKSSRLGIEELRLALESDLYFKPELRSALLQQADQRVLNPLVKAGAVQERLAHIQYESLRAHNGRATCRAVAKVQRETMKRLNVTANLPPAERRRELTRRLRDWHQRVQLEDYVSQPLDDLGSLTSLEPPLRYFLEAEPADWNNLLARLYAKLYRQQLEAPAEGSRPELEAALNLTRQAWQQALPETQRASFETRVHRREAKVRARHARRRRDADKERAKLLREFLRTTHKQLKLARRGGCQQGEVAPTEIEAQLTMLLDIAQVAAREDSLRAELERYAPRLRTDVEELEAVLSQCSHDAPDPWRADAQQGALELARTLQQELSAPSTPVSTGGG